MKTEIGMHNPNGEFSILGVILWLSSLVTLIMANITKSDVTFVMGLIVSTLAAIYYVIQIKRSLKK